MPEHKVFCAKLKQELPGLQEPPFDSELGQKIYNEISQQAWNQWMEYCKMLLNEYRLNPARREDQTTDHDRSPHEASLAPAVRAQPVGHGFDERHVGE